MMITTVATIYACLFSLAAVQAISNTMQVVSEIKNARNSGETPLVGKSITTLTVATLINLLAIWGFVSLFSLLLTMDTIFDVVLTFIVSYGLSNLVVYISVWAMWAIYTKVGKQKEIKRIKEEEAKEEVF